MCSPGGGPKWESAQLGEVCDLAYGKILTRDKLKEAGYPVWSGYSVVGYHSEYMFENPEVAITCRGVGGTGNVHMTPPKSWVTNLAITILPHDDSQLDKHFLYWALKASDRSALITGSAQHQITIGHLSRHRVPVPTLPVQKRIAHILGTLDDKIELNRRMNRTLEAIPRAIFKSWFVDFDPVHAKAEGREPVGMDPETAALFPDSFQDSPLGKIPKGWRISAIGKEFDVTMGQSPPGSTYNEEGDGMPFFQGRRDFGFRFPAQRVYCTAPKRVAEEGDTLVSVRAPVGDVNMAPVRLCLGRGLAGVRHGSGSRSYTYYSMLSLQERFRVFESEGTVFGAINKGQFSGLDWLNPGSGLVRRFEELLSPLDELIRAGALESSRLESVRDSLLPRLLAGSLEVTD